MIADRKPTFYNLANTRNEQLMKETGLLAWGMKEYYGYDSFLATYENGDYLNLKYLPGLRMEFIPRRTGRFLPDSLLWLMKNAKRIDVLYIFHAIMSSFLRAYVYKLFNPRGKVYVKLDGWPSPNQGKPWKRPFYRWLMKHADCVSTELEENAELLSRKWGRRVICVPNPSKPNELQPFRPFSERSNTILTVGRLGTRQKATEILLEAFAQIAAKIPNWTLKLAGRTEENTNIAEEFYAEHPELKDRVIFPGEIRDRQTLIDMYRDAKIFAFPSRHEGCPLALTEALTHGLFAVTSNILPHKSMTENFRYALGSEVDDIDGLAKNLFYACTHEAETESLAHEGMTATRERIDLRRCCNVIAEELK